MIGAVSRSQWRTWSIIDFWHRSSIVRAWKKLENLVIGLAKMSKLLKYATIFFLPLLFCTVGYFQRISNRRICWWLSHSGVSTACSTFAAITSVRAVITYAVIILMLSTSARNVSKKFGQRTWQRIKRAVKWLKMFAKTSEEQKQKQKIQLDEGMLDLEKTAWAIQARSLIAPSDQNDDVECH